jgi:hypothetical protein
MHIGRIPGIVAGLKPDSPVILFLGPTGIGKTMAVAEGAKISGRRMAAIPPLSTMLPEDAGGVPIPDIEAGIVRFLPPDFWHVKSGALLFLDELNLARVDVLSALCSVLWPLADDTRRVGSHVLPEDTVVVAAAMPPSPGSPAKPLPHFLRSRLCIIGVEASITDWITWATRSNVDPTVISFLFQRGDLLSPAPPTDQHISAFPTPRAWARVSSLIKNGSGALSSATREMVAGLVGPGAASEYLSFRSNITLLPDPRDVISGEVEFPENASVAVATASAIVQLLLSNADDGLINAYFETSKNWPPEYVMGIQFPAIQNMMPKWKIEHGLDLAQITVNHPDWFRHFKEVIESIRDD